MGKSTYQSIGHPLPERHNIVISSTLLPIAGIEICPTFSAGINLAKTLSKDIFCIGGAKIYRQALTIAEVLHISWVGNNYSGDCYFPEIDLTQWQETDSRDYPEFVHCTYIRKIKNAP
jgi:dihydrofolate reductase